MIDTFTAASLSELTAAQSPPCLSLYQPTHRHNPDKQQDPIRYRNLLKTLADSLRRDATAAEVESLLEPFEALAHEHDFWNCTRDGLAVFGTRDLFRVFRLQRAVPELAVVATSFHTKPLRRYLQSLDRYQVLGLTRTACRLFEGNRDRLDEIAPLRGVPQTVTEALGEELTEPRLTVAAYGSRGGADGAMHHGHGGRKDQTDLDAERFFRVVDRAVLEHYSRPSGLPLLLAALPEHHHMFRTLSHNPHLLEDALGVDPEALDPDALRERAWEVVEPHHRARQAARAEAFVEARAHGRASDELTQVAEAAAAGRVAELLLEAGRHSAGRLDHVTGQVEPSELADPAVDDVLDDLGELVENLGGEVRVLPPERMPSATGLAATFRY